MAWGIFLVEGGALRHLGVGWMELALPVIVFFMLGMTGIGVWHARKVRSVEDFALAGRRIGAPVLAGTLIATWIGTGSLFGNSEFTYMNGTAGFFLPLSGVVGMLILAHLAPRVRELPASSVPQILGLRFGRVAQLLSAFAIVLAYLVIVSYQYRAGAAVAERIFPGADQVTLRVGFAVFIILYTALAGLISVALTRCRQRDRPGNGFDRRPGAGLEWLES